MRKLTLAFITSLIAGTAVAAPVSWVATGVIEFTRDSQLLPLNPQVGDAFTYSIVFDDATPDAIAWAPYVGDYPDAILSATLSIGDQSFDMPITYDHRVQVHDDPWEDYYSVAYFITQWAVGTYPLLRSDLVYSSTSPLAPGSDALPSVPPADFSIYSGYLYLSEYQNEGQATDPEQSSQIPFVVGRVSSIVARPVPEPAAVVLLAMGLFGAGLARYRRD